MVCFPMAFRENRAVNAIQTPMTNPLICPVRRCPGLVDTVTIDEVL